MGKITMDDKEWVTETIARRDLVFKEFNSAQKQVIQRFVELASRLPLPEEKKAASPVDASGRERGITTIDSLEGKSLLKKER